jgi:hypothetical protein
VNARKSNRRWLTMLAALIAISVVCDAVGLVIHYGFTFRHAVAHDIPVAHDLTVTSLPD